jgi:prepilin-type N-terminal cleavage/methylation domain-containing protein/prepilin-type processing-associated H-X9-DG protein
MNASRHAAFTLVELSAVIVILGILIAVSIPALGYLRSSADRTGCINNLRQIGLIVHNAAADNDGRIPNVSTDSNPNESGKVFLAEFIKANGGPPDLLVCPTEKRLHQVSTSSYFWLSFFGNSPLGTPAARGVSVPASQAPLVLENWGNGALPHASKGALSSAGNVLMADGSVKKLPLDGDRLKMEGRGGGFSLSLPGN